MHIGQKISEIITQRHLNKVDLANAIGVKRPAVNYLLKRSSIDVETLAQISNAVKYNFFKHYPVQELMDANSTIALSADAIENKKMQEKISELEKQLESCKRDLVMQKQENGYLKKINELLEKTK